jgi:hypothetical protein
MRFDADRWERGSPTLCAWGTGPGGAQGESSAASGEAQGEMGPGGNSPSQQDERDSLNRAFRNSFSFGSGPGNGGGGWDGTRDTRSMSPAASGYSGFGLAGPKGGTGNTAAAAGQGMGAAGAGGARGAGPNNPGEAEAARGVSPDAGESDGESKGFFDGLFSVERMIDDDPVVRAVRQNNYPAAAAMALATGVVPGIGLVGGLANALGAETAPDGTAPGSGSSGAGSGEGGLFAGKPRDPFLSLYAAPEVATRGTRYERADGTGPLDRLGLATPADALAAINGGGGGSGGGSSRAKVSELPRGPVFVALLAAAVELFG